MEHKGVWILAEQSGGRVARISHELLTRGRELADKRGTELAAMIFGHNIDAGDLQGLIDCGADRVVATEAPELAHFLPDKSGHMNRLRLDLGQRRQSLLGQDLAHLRRFGKGVIRYIRRHHPTQRAHMDQAGRARLRLNNLAQAVDIIRGDLRVLIP